MPNGTGGAPGKFITLEGGEGSGKSTQIAFLAEGLRRAGLDVITTREPGGAPGAEEIRDILVKGSLGKWDPVSEALLHSAARRVHLERTVRPALAKGQWVISDRFGDSTVAYQGYGHGVPLDDIALLYRLSVGEMAPDLTFILDIDPETGLGRARGRRAGYDRYEQLGVDFHRRVRNGFVEIAKAHPERCIVVDASKSVETVRLALAEEIGARLGVSIMGGE